MKILLTTLNSKYIHSNLSIKYLYCLAAEAGDGDLDVDLLEFTINNERDYIFGQILRGGYDMVCISCYIWNIEMIKDLGRDLKKARPNLLITLGGPEVSYDSKEFLAENPWADFIIRGEGETAFGQFCEQLCAESPDLSKVNNLTWREGGHIYETEPARLTYTDKLPFPYNTLEVEEDKIIYYESVRGCPYNCSYCLSSVDKTVRPMSLERVRRDIGYLSYKNVKQVKFIDRTFNYDAKRANEIWRYIIGKDNGKTNYHFEICGDLLDSDSFRILSKARKGLFQFEIGVQSCNPYTLEAIHRKGQVMDTLQNAKKLVELGNCHVHVDLIAGLPYEDYRSFSQSFNMVYQVGADNLQLGFLKMLKGTQIREEAAVHGYVFRDKAPYEFISNNYLSAMDVVKLKMVETVLELFHNRGGFETTLELLMQEMELKPFRMYEYLADFYYTKGYHHASHKKEDLYRILYKFAMKQEAKHRGLSVLVQQYLTADMKQALNEDTVKRFMNKGWDIQ